MNKLLAIVKREYVERVRTKLFIVATLLGPLIMLGFAVVPGLVFGLKAGGPTRLAIVDRTGRLYDSVSAAFTRAGESGGDDAPAAAAANRNSIFESRYQLERATDPEELNRRIARDQLDAYLVLPENLLGDGGGPVEYYGRNLGDVVATREIRERVSEAVVEQRMSDNRIDRELVRRLSKRVEMNTSRVSERGAERDSSGGSFMLAFVVGFFIYITTLMYGQAILGAVVEEKQTRVVEMLFSAVDSFTLMIGKLLGVSLVALTQYAIWTLAAAVFALYGVGALAASGVELALPPVAPAVVVYFFLFFLLGYFLYATIYLLVGSMVTTTQEGGQLIMPIIFLLIIGFYLAFPVIRSPSSSFAFWVSMIPFFSPITMVVRIVTETPPFWQIALSLLIGAATVIALIWLAARIYRVGMLMYGKRASIPEVWRWIRYP